MTNDHESDEHASDERDPKKGARYASKPKKKGWRKFVTPKALLLWFLGFVALCFAGVGAAFALIDVPSPNDFSTSEASIVYYSDGETELGRFSEENRQVVEADEIPESMKLAAVAAEDRSFYENPGFDVSGIARAARDAIAGGGGGGGSTITQQYVKNYYLTQDREITRKLREIVLAVKVDQATDKDQILADYLNTIWFGRGAYGIQTAAQAYFGVDIAEVDLAQSVALASILRSPSLYDPTLGEDNAQRFAERFQYVLDGLVEIGALDRADADAVEMPEIAPEERSNTYGGPEGYLLQMARDELIAQGFDETEIETGGLRIVTTFDKQAQDAAVAAVESERPTEDAEDVRVGLASVRPGDGAVVAAYGGPDAVDQPMNDSVDPHVQIGSTAKPFTLASLLENGYSLYSTFNGNSPLSNPVLGPPVNNQGDRSYGRYTSLLSATERSVNTAFIDATLELGADNVIDTMTRAGLPESALDGDVAGNPRVSIGIGLMSVLDLANGYATFAGEGVQADPYVVTEVTDREGTERYVHESTAEQAIDQDVAADVTYALSQVVESWRGTGSEAQRMDRPVAGKTGTHEQLTSWFAGYTPQLATAVGYFRGEGTGVGTEPLTDVGEGSGTFTGGAYPARTFTTYMIDALEGEPEEEFPDPAWLQPEPRGSGGGSGSSGGGSGTGGGGGGGGGRGDNGGGGGDDDSDDDDDSSDESGDESGDEGGDESGDEPTDEPTDDPSDESGGDESGGDESGDETGDESSGDEAGSDWGGTEGGTENGDDGGTEGGTENGDDGGTEGGTDGGGDTGTDNGAEGGDDSGTDAGTEDGGGEETAAGVVAVTGLTMTGMGMFRRFVDRNRTPDYVAGDDEGPTQDLAESVRGWIAEGTSDRDALYTRARREADDAAPYLTDDEVAAIVDGIRGTPS